MRMKIAISFFVIMLLYLITDSVIGLAMSVEIRNPDANVIEEADVSCHFMQATAYCLDGRTASGDKTRIGIAASKPEWIGKTMAVYEKGADGKAGNFIGYFEVKDTGGESIRSGKVIDLWLPTYEECMAFGRKDVVVFLIDGANG